MIRVNGMAHVILTVTSFDAALEFYDHLLPFLGLTRAYKSTKLAYWVGGRTALGIQPCSETYQAESFVQYRVGLHHLCFRARERADIDKAAVFLSDMSAHIVRGPEEGTWAPGYYYVLFEDPDCIRLEICFVPEKGVLAQHVTFNPTSDF